MVPINSSQEFSISTEVMGLVLGVIKGYKLLLYFPNFIVILVTYDRGLSIQY